MKNRSYGYRSDSGLTESPADQGVLWIATQPLVSGFLDAKKAYDDGTAETRSILVRECSLIYECNVCRNMFRSLANFVKHKRVYCCKSFFDQMGSSNRNAPQHVIQNQKKKYKVPADSNNWSNLILKMLAAEQKSKPLNAEIVVDACSNEEQAQIGPQSENMAVLINTKNVPNTIRISGSRDDAKDSNIFGTHLKDSTVAPIKQNIKYSCEECQRSFDTPRSLKIHIQKKHRTPKHDFQCPSCSLTFPQPAAVVQHLSSEHKKSMRCIKLMHDSLQKDEVVHDELQKKNNAYEDMGHKIKSSTCLYCMKSFQRRAVLLTHQHNCKFKNLYQNNDVLSPKTKNEVTSDTTQTSPSLNESNELTTDPSFEEQSFFPNDAVGVTTLKPHIHEAHNIKVKKQKIKSKYLPCLCKICHKHFSALSNLRRHISMIHYRTRKFACKLCEYRAFRKYDVINHLGHIHKILGDKETMTSEYIDEHEESSTRDVHDEDVIIVTDVENVKSMENLTEISTEEHSNIKNETPPVNYKSKGYKPFLISARFQKSIPRDRQKLKRSVSQQLLTFDTHHKRPKRNRITPVDKDFVYDLNAILKNNDHETERETGRILKKRDTFIVTSDQHTALNENIKNNKNYGKNYKPLITCSADFIKGTAQKTAVFCVHQGRAAYSSLPQLPTERPQVRMRQATIYRAEFSAVPVIEATDLVEARFKTKLLDDSFLENLTTTATDDFKMKPRLALPQSTINSLLKKVDLTLQNHMKIKTEMETKEHVGTVPNIPVKQEMEVEESGSNYFQLQNTGVEHTYSQYVCMHQEEEQRIEAMRECLMGNEPKQSESLLRFALEN